MLSRSYSQRLSSRCYRQSFGLWLDGVSAAVQGQDAVIDNTFTEDAETPLRLIDAAAASGIYRLWVTLSNLFIAENPPYRGRHGPNIF